MNRKKLFGFDYTNNENIKFLCYIFVGGSAALIEWCIFYIFNYTLLIPYLSAAALAFLLATIYHYILGNILVFTSNSRYNTKKEFSLVLLVSIIGLLLNLMFMFGFVSILSLSPILSKIITSILVFFWNYLSRKKFIF